MRILSWLKPNAANIGVAAILSVVLTPFITYDTGIRCITTPCDSAKTGTLVEYLIKAKGPEPYDVEYGVFLLYGLGFYGMGSIAFGVTKKLKKKNPR